MKPILLYADLRTIHMPCDTLLSHCSAARRAVICRRPPMEQAVSAMAELLLRAALQTVGQDPKLPVIWQGKPRFADHAVPYTFNLTHAAQTAAVLLTPRNLPCGVDCEEYRSLHNRTALANRLFSEQERRWIDTQPDTAAAFFHIWTAKEAFIKYTGEGFSRPLHSVVIDMDNGHAGTADTPKLCHIFHTRTQYALLCSAYAAPSPPESIRCTAEMLCACW